VIAAAAKPPTKPRLVDPLDAFRARAEARAYPIGDIDLHTAVDELQASAERDGLVDLIGADAVQTILSEAFSEYRESSQ
jgi:hypothetical protein